ncbi:MAG: SusC/RagA family TonB-linked outer membrane protein [Gemmatimonadaceae bacterium]|nr:SusC/RagA family TonB-linked outer membrane protein [Gemmatimonadaceae bacterium]
MSFDLSRRIRQAVFALASFALPLTGVAQAQTTISGRITDPDKQPLANATVLIPSLSLRASTNATGAYTLVVPSNLARAQQVVLSARAIGFKPQTRTISLAPGGQVSADFQMVKDPLRLEQVVVTGVSDEQSVTKLPISVAKIDGEQLNQVPATSPIAALAGKVAGAKVNIGAGGPGGAPVVRLRGSTSLGVGGSSPLIIIDGVFTKNNLADIDVSDIESIEVLKGAAASSFYGSDAASGVINIATKRGKGLQQNRVTYSLRNEFGRNDLWRMIPLNKSHAFQTDPTTGEIITNAAGARVSDPNNIADNPFPSGANRWRNQLEEWAQNGDFRTTNLQVGLRRGNTNLNTSFAIDQNEGLLPFRTGQSRRNFRLNVDQGLNDKMDLSAGITYGNIFNDFSPDGATGAWFSFLQMPGDVDLKNPGGNAPVDYYPLIPVANSPSARVNPLYELVNQEFARRRERILGSFAFRYRPTNWLRVEAQYGTDRLNTNERTYRFRGYLQETGAPGTGLLADTYASNIATNTQVTATATKRFFDKLNSTTRAMWLRELESNRSVFAQGTRLNVTDVPDLAAADPAQVSVNSGYVERRTVNYMLSQSFDFKDRYILDALYRRDGSSLFGPDARFQNFYRVAGAYRISEDFKLPGVQEFRIRAARGTAGLRPGFSDQFETYSLSAGQVSKAQLGNRLLKPAIQTEDEYGFNLAFLNRFDLEVVNAKRVTEGAFLNVPLSLAQSGGFLSQIQNAADISATSTEVTLNAVLADGRNFGWNVTLTGDRTRQNIDRLGRAPFRVNAGGQGQDVFYYREGTLGIMFGTKYARSYSDCNIRMNAAGGCVIGGVVAPADSFVVNPLGFLVRRSLRGAPNEAPIVLVDGTTGVNQFQIGDVNPDFNFGIANTIRFGNFSLYTLFDGQVGGDIYNFTKQWMFQDLRHGDLDQAGKADADKVAQTFYSGGLYNALAASEYFVEDGSYMKIREVSLGYNVPLKQLRSLKLDGMISGLKLSLIGRNLFTFTNYTGFDPEVANGDLNFRIDGFRYPNFRTLTGAIEINF